MRSVMRPIARHGLVGAAAVVLVLAAIVAGARFRAEPEYEPLLDAVVAAGVPGALALVEDGSRRQLLAAGLAARSPATRMRALDRFRVGSVTKTFVAAVVLQLVAEGKLELDAPVGRWLPGLVPPAITVRHLLAHTSGLDDYVNDPRAFDLGSPRGLIALAGRRPTLGEPGERYAYASTNYLVLGLLVERVTGTSLERQLEERLFRPLGLARTTFEPGAVRLHVHGYRALSHDGIVFERLEDTTGEDAGWAWAAGAIVSRADDVAAFFDALLAGRVVPQPLLGEMIPERGYGLGLASFRSRCGLAVGHTGNVLGYVSVVWNSPDRDRRVVLMGNVYPIGPDAERAIRALLEAAFCD